MKFSESLKKYQQFQSVYKYGKTYANKYLVMYIMEMAPEGTGLEAASARRWATAS